MLLGTVATKDKALAKAAAEGSKQQDRALAAEREHLRACIPAAYLGLWCATWSSVSTLHLMLLFYGMLTAGRPLAWQLSNSRPGACC